MQQDRSGHCFEIGAAAHTDRAERDAAPGQQQGSSPVPDGDRLVPIRLMCPPTANAFSDIAMVPGPPISAAIVGQGTYFFVPIRGLAIVDHVGRPNASSRSAFFELEVVAITGRRGSGRIAERRPTRRPTPAST